MSRIGGSPAAKASMLARLVERLREVERNRGGQNSRVEAGTCAIINVAARRGGEGYPRKKSPERGSWQESFVGSRNGKGWACASAMRQSAGVTPDDQPARSGIW